MNIYEIATRYLEHRPRTVFEMKEHLRKKEFEEDEILTVINKLLERHYLDDKEYVYQYAIYAFEKSRGTYRIKYELKQKGVSEFDIEDGLYEYSNFVGMSLEKIEFENASMQAEKILKDNELSDKEKRKKIFDKVARRLNSLGYSTSIIISVLEKYRGM